MKTDLPISVVIADDHAVVRDGLRALFASEPGFVVAAEASDGAQAVDLAARLKPDIVILDISMPHLNGIEATRAIKANVPETGVLILTVHESEEFIHQLIHAGAQGYLLKNAEKKEILNATRAVVQGETYFSPSVSRLLIDTMVRQTRGEEAMTRVARGVLTLREEEILRLIAEGLSSREIAEQLHISFRTVNSHRTNLMKKLDIHETAGLVRYAIQHRILPI